MSSNTFPILLAEDSKHDVLAVKRAWKLHNLVNPLHVVRDGQECLDYLFQKGSYSPPADAPRPGLLLLDLNMPKVDGLTALKRVRDDDDLGSLIVVVLTTSKRDEDRIESYNLNVNAYIKKPVDFDNFSEAIRRISLFWQICELPS
ncbi:MAG: response regulator [Pseudomonadales bacterium]